MICRKSSSSSARPTPGVWWFAASCTRCAACSMVLVGMQPRRMHSPPSSPSLNMTVRAPAAAAVAAAILPALPPPMTITSYSVAWLNRSLSGCCLPGWRALLRDSQLLPTIQGFAADSQLPAEIVSLRGSRQASFQGADEVFCMDNLSYCSADGENAPRLDIHFRWSITLAAHDLGAMLFAQLLDAPRTCIGAVQPRSCQAARLARLAPTGRVRPPSSGAT